MNWLSHLQANWRALWQPNMYHGHGRTQRFFEGWYFKVVDAHAQHVYAFIPGVFLGETPAASHAFVQVLQGNTGQATYHRYPLSDFWASTDTFAVRVGPNYFSAETLTLAITEAEHNLQGTLRFSGLTPWPVTLTAPGIMGWYAFMPFMECYHGVVSLDHTAQGTLVHNGQTLNFEHGRGYTEKDWGQAFPRAWVWVQTNHFGAPGVSLSASVATIPWLGSAFQGFIVGFLHHGHLYRFATYTGAKTTRLRVSPTQIVWHLSDGRHRLELVAERNANSGTLHAPAPAAMQARVQESLSATVHVRLVALPSEQAIFAGTGHHAGLEVSGTLQTI